METALVVVGLLVTYLVPLGALIAPPVVMLDQRRLRPVAALLYVGAITCVAIRFLALDANIDRADRTGEAGSIFAGWSWLALAVVLAVASVLVTLAKRRPRPAQ